MKKHVALLAFALVGAAVPNAEAISNTHAAEFHAFNAGEVTSIDYITNAVYNIAASPRSVIAPVTFIAPFAWSGTATFWVDGKVAAGNTLSFTMYAYGPNGALLSSANTMVSVSGNFDRRVDLPGVSNTNYVSLFSSLPANTGTQFYGILSVT